MTKSDDETALSAYFQALSGLPLETLTEFRKKLRQRMPEATERIYYQMPTFVLEKPVIAYAAFKAHWGLFPCSGSIIPQLGYRLNGYKWSKSGIQIAYGQMPPDDLLDDILRLKQSEIAEAMAAKRRA
jgi:uncharacterized protein YdhG (YjbR/CyaY superfamily)